MAIQIQVRRDTAVNWTTHNPILANGEMGLEKDTNRIKFGDGINTWSNLDYYAIGEDNTASNLGDGEGLYYEKSGSDLRFKSLKATGGVSLTSDGTSVTISGAELDGGTISFTDLIDTPSNYEDGSYLRATSSGIIYEVDYTTNLIYVQSEYDGDFSNGSFDQPFKHIYEAVIFANATYGEGDNVAVHMLPGVYNLPYQVAVTNPAIKAIIGTNAQNVVMKPTVDLLGLPFAIINQPLEIRNVTMDASDIPAFATTSGSIGTEIREPTGSQIIFSDCIVRGFHTSFACVSGSNTWFKDVDIYDTSIGIFATDGSLVDADILYIDGAREKHIYATGAAEVYIGESELSSYYIPGLLASGTAIYASGTDTYVELFAGTNIWSCNRNVVLTNGAELKIDNCVLEETNTTPGIAQYDGSILTILNSRAPLGSDDLHIDTPASVYINSFDSSNDSTTIGRGGINSQKIFSIETGQANKPHLFFDTDHYGRHAVAFVEPNENQPAEFYTSANNAVSATACHIYGSLAHDHEAELQLVSTDDVGYSGWYIRKGSTDQPNLYFRFGSSVYSESKPMYMYYDGDISLKSGVRVDKILDEDNFASNDPKALITQQSARAFTENYTYSSTALDAGQLDTRYRTHAEIDAIASGVAANYVRRDGTSELTADWDAGPHEISAGGFRVDDVDLDLAGYANITGILTGGTLTINGSDNTKLDVEAGTGIMVNMTDRDNPVVEIISWSGATISPNLSGIRSKWIGIQKTAPGVGSILVQTNFTQTELRSIIALGKCWGNGTDVITGRGNYKAGAFSFGKSMQDIAYAIGSINIAGNSFFPTASGSMKLSRTAGESFRFAANYTIEEISPNISSSTAASGISSYNYHIQDQLYTNSESNIDPNYYDLDGTKTAVPADKWTVQRVYYFPVSNTVHITYDQHYHDSYAEAYDDLGNDHPVLNTSILEGSILRAFLIIKQGCSDLADTTQVKIIEASSIGAGGGGTTGGGITDHGALSGLGDDDHQQYTLVNGTRSFTNKINYSSHPTFSNDTELIDKKYVDDLASSFTLDHGELPGLLDDDHPQYLTEARGDALYYTQEQVDTISGAITNKVTTLTALATVQTARSTTYSVQTSWANITFDETSYENQPEILEHDTNNLDRILIKADGTYSLTYGTVVEAQTTTTTTYARLLKNGITEVPASDAQIRSYQGERHELSGSVTRDLLAGDYVVLQLYRSTDGAVNVVDANYNIIKLDGVKGEKGDTGDTGPAGQDGLVTISGSAYFDAYDAAGGLNVPSSWVDIPFNSTRMNSGEFTLTGNTELVIPITTVYHITSRVTTDSSGSVDLRIRLVRDTGSGYAEVPGSLSYNYASSTTDAFGTSTCTVLSTLNEGDKIKVQASIGSGTSTLVTVANGSSLIVHIPGGMPGTNGIDGADGADGAPGSGSTIIVKDEGTNVSNTPHSAFNFTGAGVTTTDAGGGIATINIPGGGGITVKDEGSSITGTPHTTLNFTGQMVTATDAGSGQATINIPYPEFGTWYAWGGDESETSTNSASPVQKATMAFNGVPAAYYRLGWYYEWRRNTGSNDYYARVQIDNTTTVMEHAQEPQDVNSWHPVSGYVIVNLSAGNHFIDFDHWGESTANVSYTRRLRFEIWRVA